MSGLEVLAILTAVKDANEVLGQFLALIRRYADLPRSILVLRHRISGCEHALKKWERTWGIEDGRPNAYYEVFWGRNGWAEVREVVGTLRIICNNLNESVSSMVNSVDKATRHNRRPHPPYVYERHVDEALVRESIKRITRSTNDRRWNRFMKACKNEAAELEYQVREFNRSLRALRRISNGKFEEMHGLSWSRRRRHLQPAEIVRLLTGRDMRSHQEARADAVSLHEAFKSGNRTGQMKCHLGMTVVTLAGSVQNRTQPDPKKDFQMLLETPLYSCEVLVHPAKFNNDRGTLRREVFLSSFVDVLAEIQQGATKPSNLLPPSNQFENGFTVRTALDAQLNESVIRQPLRHQLHRILRREKVHVAYTLASGFFRLLGSPWADYLECGNIRTKPIAGDLWAALLDASPGDRLTSTIFQRTTQLFQRSNREMKYHCHVYRLGIVLAEIALGQQITFLKLDRVFGPKIVLDIQADQGLDAEVVAGLVEDEMDGTFGDVVYFCVSVFQQEDLRALNNLDDDFARCVLDPLVLTAVQRRRLS